MITVSICSSVQHTLQQFSNNIVKYSKQILQLESNLEGKQKVQLEIISKNFGKWSNTRIQHAHLD